MFDAIRSDIATVMERDPAARSRFEVLVAYPGVHALAFGVQQVAQAFEFGNKLLDLCQRRSGDALDQRIDVGDGRLGGGVERGLVGVQHARRAAQIGDIVAHEIADAGLDFRDGGKVAVHFGFS